MDTIIKDAVLERPSYQFQPGNPGKKVGTPNKVTRTIRDALKASFEQVGGTAALVKLHNEHPEAYFQLIGKLIPAEIAVDVTVTLQLGNALIDAQRRLEAHRAAEEL